MRGGAPDPARWNRGARNDGPPWPDEPAAGRAGPGLGRPGKRRTGLPCHGPRGRQPGAAPARRLLAPTASRSPRARRGLAWRSPRTGTRAPSSRWGLPCRAPSANRVSYAHGALTEWYANGPLGIEQGFDVAARPAAAAGPLTLSLALSGNLAARLRGGSVLLSGRGATLRYGNLRRDRRARARAALLAAAGQGARADPRRGPRRRLSVANRPADPAGRKAHRRGRDRNRPVRLQRRAVRRRRHGADRRRATGASAPGRRGCSRARARPGPSRAESSSARATPEKANSATSEKANSA